MKHTLLILTIASLLTINAFADPIHDNATSGKLQRVLIFSKTAWYRHPALPEVNGFLVRLGAKHNIQMDVTESPEDFSRLNNYQAIIFNSTTDIGKTLNKQQRKQLKDWYHAGGGIM